MFPKKQKRGHGRGIECIDSISRVIVSYRIIVLDETLSDCHSFCTLKANRADQYFHVVGKVDPCTRLVGWTQPSLRIKCDPSSLCAHLIHVPLVLGFESTPSRRLYRSNQVKSAVNGPAPTCLGVVLHRGMNTADCGVNAHESVSVVVPRVVIAVLFVGLH